MNILVYGLGAIGGYIAANLADVGHDVGAVVRPHRVAETAANGITITEGERTIHATIAAYGSLQEAVAVRPYDLIVLGVKSYHLPGVIADLVAHYPHAPMILSTQNGIGVEDGLIAQFGRQRVLASAVTATVSHQEDGALLVEKPGRGLAIAPTQLGQEIGRYVGLFDGSMIVVKHVADYRAMKWSKAMFNLIGNASSAILNMRPADIYKHPQLFKLEMQMIREMLAVMKTEQIPVVNLASTPSKLFAWSMHYLPTFLKKPLMQYVIQTGRGNKMPSFNLDLQAGRPTSEVIFHNAAIARIGTENGIAVPVNTMLSEVLVKLVDKELAWEQWQLQPDKLAAVLREKRHLLRESH